MTDNHDFPLDKRQICRLPYPRKATQLLLWSLVLRQENKETRNLSPEAPKKIWKRDKYIFLNTLNQQLKLEELPEDNQSQGKAIV